MWSKIFIIISVVFTTGIATNVFIDLDNSFKPFPIFHRDHGYALIDHVIKTLSLYIAECFLVCQETLSCFSFNYREFINGTYVCELNRSNKKQSPESFVRKEGYEYAESTDKEKNYCEQDECHEKDALPGDWYKFNTSSYKMISEYKTWTEARQHCQSLGGELASFTKEIQNRFVLALSDWLSRLVRYRMDGTDPGLSLFNGAAVVDKDGSKAVYFDGVNDYATIPRFDTLTTDWTIAVWFKDNGAINTVASIMNDVDSVRQFNIYFYHGVFAIDAFNTDNKVTIGGITVPKSEFPLNQWTHLAITWDRTAKETKVFYNAILKASRTALETNVDFFETPYPTFEVGANKKGGKGPLKGWLKDLIVSKKTFTQDEIQALKDGLLYEAWIGLNDITTESTFLWSDGTPLTYTQSSTISSNTPDNDCVELIKLGENVFAWMTSNCNKKKMFICKRN